MMTKLNKICTGGKEVGTHTYTQKSNTWAVWIKFAFDNNNNNKKKSLTFSYINKRNQKLSSKTSTQEQQKNVENQYYMGIKRKKES